MTLWNVKKVCREPCIFDPGISAKNKASVIELGHRVDPINELHAWNIIIHTIDSLTINTLLNFNTNLDI